MLSSELWCTLTCTPRIYKYNELKCQTSTQQYRKCTTHSIHKVYHTHSRNDSLDEKGQSLVLVEIYAWQKFALKKGGSLAQCTCFELRLVKHHPRAPEWTACMTSDLPCRNISVAHSGCSPYRVHVKIKVILVANKTKIKVSIRYLRPFPGPSFHPPRPESDQSIQ